MPELLAHNPLDPSVLLYYGEELIGAKQNRILNVTVLVTAASETVADDMPFLVDSISRTGSGGTRPGLTALE